jgi:hypothetical protein
MAFSTRRTTRTAIAFAGVAILAAASAAPSALANGEGKPFTLGQRNPGSGGLTKESQVIANIAQGQGGSSKTTGGYSTRQSNLSSSGGGAIYGCRATTGTQACVSANNLANGDAFRFQAGTNAPEVGQFRFGANINTLFPRPPFAVNGTGTVANLSADKLDGIDSTAFLQTTTAASTYLTQANAATTYAPIDIAPFAVVAASGSVSNGHFTSGNATVSTASGNAIYTVTFTRSVASCAANVTPTDTGGFGHDVAASTTGSQAIVTEDTTTGFGFNLSLTCAS